MIDLNPSAMRRSEAVRAIHEAVDTELAQRLKQPRKRDYVGASAIGGMCERRIQYDYVPSVEYDESYQPDGRTQRIFDRGHAVEELAIGWLSSAGFKVRTVKPDGKQYGFETAGGRFAGHVDGVIVEGLSAIETPCIWEHKALGVKSWKALERHGVAKAKPEYADQIATYQAYMDLKNPALFMATNMDTMEIYFELVTFDLARAQAASDRAAAIISDTEVGALRPRVNDDPEFWLCRFCPYRDRCHA